MLQCGDFPFYHPFPIISGRRIHPFRTTQQMILQQILAHSPFHHHKFEGVVKTPMFTNYHEETVGAKKIQPPNFLSSLTPYSRNTHCRSQQYSALSGGKTGDDGS